MSIEYINGAVHRPCGYWTKSVHTFLRFLRSDGFMQAPEPIGFDCIDREIVSFVEGEVGDDPLSEELKSLETLCSSAQLLRAYHDASKNFLKRSDVAMQQWMFPCRYPQEVMCHNDFAPYNICFEGQKAVGIIDFDTAHPGPRIWDIAYALYRFAPFYSSEFELENQITRARLFCDEYGLVQEDRTQLTDLIIERLKTLIDFLVKAALSRDEKYQNNMEEGHHLKYFNDIAYIKLHKSTIENGLK